MPSEELAVIGDDLEMDVVLGGSRMILVRSGINGVVDLERVSERRPDAVGEILEWL